MEEQECFVTPIKLPMGIREILQILPHRPPFLLVDRILELDLEKNYVVGQKNVTINEPFFEGHFPNAPLMPGVLILEALAQAGGVLVHLKSRHASHKIAVLLGVQQAKFRCPVRPGDILTLRGTGLHFGGKGGVVQAEALVGDRIAVEAQVTFALIDRAQI